MKKSSLIVATLLLCTSLYAGGDIEAAAEETTAVSSWNFNLLMEERVFSDKTSQTLLKLQADTMLTEELTLWGGVWLRDKLPVYTDPSHLSGESEYINYVDIFVGLSYSLHKYFNPYVFIEEYIDRGHETNQYGSFSAIGFSGTLYNEGKHNVGYFTEWYYTLNTYDLENWNLWGTETAVKYKYTIYENTQLYIQGVWNTDSDDEGYGVHGYTDGIYSTRLGIQVNF